MLIKNSLICFLVLVCCQYVLGGIPPIRILKNDLPVVKVFDTSDSTFDSTRAFSCLGSIITPIEIIVSRGCEHIPVDRLFILDENAHAIFPYEFNPIEHDTGNTLGIMKFKTPLKIEFHERSPMFISNCEINYDEIKNITSVGFKTKEYPQTLVTRKISKINKDLESAPLSGVLAENEEEDDQIAEFLYGHIDNPRFNINTKFLIAVNQMKRDEKTKPWITIKFYEEKIKKALGYYSHFFWEI